MSFDLDTAAFFWVVYANGTEDLAVTLTLKDLFLDFQITFNEDQPNFDILQLVVGSVVEE